MTNQSTLTASSSLVGLFTSSKAAREAVDALHNEGFHDTWIGITRAAEGGYGTANGTTGETVVESENAVARFFGAGDAPLHEALVKRGVSEADATRLDGTLPPDSAILTVDGANHPELAAQIITSTGGRMVTSTGSSRLYDTYAEETGSSDLSTERLAGLGDYYGGEKLDEPRRIQLREERLNIDKRVEQTGEAEISKKVITERASVDVPVYHEELYIERRPASGTYTSVGEIGDSETIRIPLRAESVVVDKSTVVSGEVAVGQRRVDGVEHVSEDLKKEELKIDGADTKLV